MATPTIRRFGPSLAPGVAIVEQLGAREITPGILGTTLHWGVYERGMVGEVNSPLSSSHFDRIGGENITESLAPDAAQDFYEHAEGAGEFHFIRVTDGTEVKSQRDFYDRTDISSAADTFASETRNLVVRIRAKNGGRWAGREKVLADDHAGVGALTETTLTTGLTMLLNEWAGAELQLGQVPAKTYTVISNTLAGVVTVASDSTMLTDFGAGGNDEWELNLASVEDKNVEILFKDGIEDDTYFGMEVYYKTSLVLNYDNLSLDPANEYYFVTVINNDANNHEIEAVGALFTGAYVAARKPANHHGYIDVLTATKLTFIPFQYSVVSPTSANPVISTITGITDTLREDTLTGTVGGAGTTIAWTSTFIDDLAVETIGVVYAAKNIYTMGWTTVNGGTPLADGDIITINILPLRLDQAIGGALVLESGDRIRIVDNDTESVTVSTSTDLTALAAVGETFRVESRSRLHSGYDGADGVLDGHYTAQMDPNNSPANNLFTEGKGLIKLASPGITTVAVNLAGKNYAESKNAQWRYEVSLANQGDDEISFHTWVAANLERSDYAVAAYNSQVYVPDPIAPLLRKTVSATGMIHGREAKIAIARNGYHKAAAGVNVTLPRIVELKSDAQNRPIDEEFLNPRGYQMIKARQGTHIIWGDRTMWVNRDWMWKHQREQMTYYEETLRQNFDDVIFEINDQILWELLKARIRTFFRVEFARRALYATDGKFDSAFTVKIDSQNNTTATTAAGDLNAEISLSLANTVERFIITMGKKGVFTAIGS